ncbi:nucleotide exchange factor GrpE [Paenibacillus mucilaginosus]|uniref:Protein GrpE n=3 Tax=Paenibacillus mucilaginosus TaxID=61624 RepID=H6NIH4_9BACL|nr:nucleotide exchange factor GrpE [Paenibacillus mucilaginosus]AEI42682.1 GrpE protein [Paenibacillus mucilaginosus KNP414]AFC32285.1 GrpE protein [Paenibacillus mucilaginosus 3016]AFH64590.1 molecular chaperone GrpE [Paenibacillus mucilaginosus K02]MCG7217070.1 nucleotide exchange factor GrpE [Paenibacillus mucilaginosus]WDM26069.1 nucleotide exchange factor GrpE [Paenibacillus mucilaginosus]
MNTEQKDGAGVNPEAAGDAAEQEAKATYEHGETEAAHEEAEVEQNPVNQEIEQLKKQLEEQQGRVLRAQADFDNFRRRTLKEKEDFAKYASLKLIEQLLPVVDNFERAMAASRDNKDYDALIKGVDMIFRQLDGVLTNEGLKPMETVGTPFNPEFHQAIMQVESDEHEEGIVVEEVQKGYLLKDKVLRPAMVKVSS